MTGTILSALLALGQGQLMMLMMGGACIIIYLFIMRPEKRRQEGIRTMRQNLAKKTKVITVGGIHGTVKSTSDKAVTLIIDDKTGTTVKVSRNAIGNVVSDEEPDAGEPAQ